MAPVNIFISYSHKDKPLRGELENHLSSLKYQGVIKTWYDGIIDGGDEWDKAVQDNLETAKIILLLISSDFMASRYIRRIEIKRALERHKAGEAKVIPVILRNCFWRIEEFAKLKALPEDGKAVTSWPNQDDAFTDIAEGIHRIVESMFAKTLASLQSTASGVTAQPNPAPTIAEESASNVVPHGEKVEPTSSLAINNRSDDEQNDSVIDNHLNNLSSLDQQELDRYFELAVFPEDIAVPVPTLRKLWARTGHLDEYAADALCARLHSLSLLDYDNSKAIIRLNNVARLNLIEQIRDRLPSIHNQLLNAHKPSSVHKWSAMLDDEPYFWDQLVFHLKEAEREEQLVATLEDWQYLVKKTLLRGADSIESDLLTAQEIAPYDYRLRTIQLIFANFRGLFESWLMSGGSKAARYAEVQCLEDLNTMLQDQAQNLRMYYLTLKFKLPDLRPIGVRSCRFSYDGKQIVSASDDGVIRVWEAQSGKLLDPLEPRYVWNESLRKREILIDGHKNAVNGCDMSSAGRKLIISASDDKTLKTWNPSSRDVWCTFREHSGKVNDCCFSPNGKHFVSASSDSTLKVWTIEAEKSFRTLEGHSGSVNSCVYGNSGKWIISAHSDGTLKVWGKSDEPLHTLPAHSGPINCCSFNDKNEKGKLVASASDDKTLKIWDADEIWDADPQEPLHTLHHSDQVNGCCFSLDGKLIVSASSDHTLKIWDVESGKCQTTFDTGGEMFCCAMYEDMIVAGGARGLYFLKLVL